MAASSKRERELKGGLGWQKDAGERERASARASGWDVNFSLINTVKV